MSLLIADAPAAPALSRSPSVGGGPPGVPSPQEGVGPCGEGRLEALALPVLSAPYVLPHKVRRPQPRGAL